MNKVLTVIAAIGLCITPLAVQAQDMPDTETRMATEIVASDAALAGRVVQAEVLGMVCDFCAVSLISVLEKNDNIDRVAISLETNRVTIFLKDGGAISDEEVEKAVYWAGYELAGIERA